MTRLVRCHRLGRWVGGKIPRPVLIEFENQSDRDGFLGMAHMVAQNSGGRLRVVPDYGRKPMVSATKALQPRSIHVRVTPCNSLSMEEGKGCGILDDTQPETVVRCRNFGPLNFDGVTMGSAFKAKNE